jgi:hypothetical protein
MKHLNLIGFIATTFLLVAPACSNIDFKKESGLNHTHELAVQAFINGYYKGSIAQMRAKDNADFERHLAFDSANFRNFLKK